MAEDMNFITEIEKEAAYRASQLGFRTIAEQMTVQMFQLTIIAIRDGDGELLELMRVARNALEAAFTKACDMYIARAEAKLGKKHDVD